MNDKIYGSSDSLASIKIDIESQSDNPIFESFIINEKNDLVIPLKSILKKSRMRSNEEIVIEMKLMKVCMSLVMTFVLLPIILSDLYFGFTDNSCVNIMPNGLQFSMKLYLLVSGFVELLSLIIMLATVNLVKFDNHNRVKILIIKIINGFLYLFYLNWNILGSIVFWGMIYGSGKCNVEVSTYIFISLVLKLVGNTLQLYYTIIKD